MVRTYIWSGSMRPRSSTSYVSRFTRASLQFGYVPPYRCPSAASYSSQITTSPSGGLQMKRCSPVTGSISKMPPDPVVAYAFPFECAHTLQT